MTADANAIGVVPLTSDEDLQEHLAVVTGMQRLIPGVHAVGELLCAAFATGAVLYTFGNGGSAADAQHLTGELVGRYKRDRRPLPAVALSADATVTTCIANDFSFAEVYSRQVAALAGRGDVVAAFTTSGNSANVVSGLSVAKSKGATTVLFGGGDGGQAAALADHALIVPSWSTPRIQEMHTFMLHAISEIVDRWAAAQEQVH